MISSTFDQPRGIVLINNIQVDFIDINIMTNGVYNSDMWRVNIPMDGLPTSMNKKVLMESPDLQVKIYIGYPKNPENYNISDLNFIVQGNTDTVDPNWRQRTFELKGRDFSSLFINSLVDQSQYLNVNATAYDIVKKLVEEKGLKFNGVQTTTPIGNFFYDAYFFQPTLKTNWDLMSSLAEAENYDLYVYGDTVNFVPQSSLETYNVQYTESPNPISNTISLAGRRQMSLYKTVTVNVISYNQATKSVNVGTATNPGQTSTVKLGHEPTIYKISIPNLSPTQAQAKANSLLKKILINGIQINFESHGDLSIIKNNTINLSGTNTAADQKYYAFRIGHEFSKTDGLITTTFARNIPGQVRG